MCLFINKFSFQQRFFPSGGNQVEIIDLTIGGRKQTGNWMHPPYCAKIKELREKSKEARERRRLHT
jgi:hypothetical protein